MEFAEIKVYRMTHIDNVPHILLKGITNKNSPYRNPNFITIGDISLIYTRSARKVVVDNGDSLNFAAPSISLGDFIPFYFGVKMPMLYVMQNGGNFVRQATPAQEIVYLVCSLSSMVESHENYYFSDGHGTDSLTTFFDRTRIEDLPKILDWNSVKASYWGGQENLNVKRKKQAEFLVYNDIASDLIIGFGCYNEIAKMKLSGMGIEANKIKIIPGAYF